MFPLLRRYAIVLCLISVLVLPASSTSGQDNEVLLSILGASWSPEGDRIAFTFVEDEQHAVYIIDIESGDVTNLTEDIGGQNWDPTWSPDGSSMAFFSTNESERGRNDLWIIDLSTLETTNLTADIDGSINLYDWSPDSQQIAAGRFNFSDESGIVSEILIGSVPDFSDPIILSSSGNLSYFSPTWSPEGDRLAILSSDLLSTESRPDGDGLWIVDMTEEELRPVQLVHNQPLLGIRWSPTEDTIAAYGAGPEKFDIFLIDVNDGGLTKLTEGLDSFSRDPQWSRNGDYITFTAIYTGDSGLRDIMFVDVDSGDITNITQEFGQGFYGLPKWSPTDDVILFEEMVEDHTIVHLWDKDTQEFTVLYPQ